MNEIIIDILAIAAIILIIVAASAFAKKKKRERSDTSRSVTIPQSNTNEFAEISQSQRNVRDVYASLLYYVYLDGGKYGPFSLEQLKTYPLLEDTLVTTNTLNGIWYEAKYYECFDDLFHKNLPFRIDADGVIVRTEEHELSD